MLQLCRAERPPKPYASEWGMSRSSCPCLRTLSAAQPIDSVGDSGGCMENPHPHKCVRHNATSATPIFRCDSMNTFDNTPSPRHFLAKPASGGSQLACTMRSLGAKHPKNRLKYLRFCIVTLLQGCGVALSPLSCVPSSSAYALEPAMHIWATRSHHRCHVEASFPR